MRRRIYIDGKPAWSDPEPSEFPEEMPRLTGSIAQAALRARQKADPAVYARRQATWHASKVRHGKAAA